jgi:diadenosine tetraphosphate (Ap4A) HIT family hydrolase
MANETMLMFGYPEMLIRDYEHWVVLLRPAQVTLGSLVLAARSGTTAFGALPPEAHAELATVTRQIEATLLSEIAYEKINYLMLMMVDPNVHFHIFPRYPGERSVADATVSDTGWPGPPDLKTAASLNFQTLERLWDRLSHQWITNC